MLTPVSLSPSRSLSPMTPTDPSRSSYNRPPVTRSATAPVQQLSPDVYSPIMENPFPVSPAVRPITPITTKSRFEGGYGGFDLKPENDPMYAPLSPRLVSDGALLQRMNTIAPGPFDLNNRRRPGTAGTDRGHQREQSRDLPVVERLATNVPTARPVLGHSRSDTNSSSGSMKGLPKLPRKNGYDGFGPPVSRDDSRGGMRPEDRSQTLPLPNPPRTLPNRSPSDPADTRTGRPSMDSTGRRPSENERQRGRSNGPDLSRPLPPRGTSLIRSSRHDPRTGEAPPLPNNLNLAAEFGVGNPYHTPSTSQSSNASGYSDVSKVSSRSSPPKSVGPRSRRQPSDTTKLDILMSEVQASMSDLQPRQLLSASPPPMETEQYARGMKPPPMQKEQFGRSMNGPAPMIREQYARDINPSRGLDPSMLGPESPMDPAIQNGRLSPIPRGLAPRSLRPEAPPSPRKLEPVRKSSRPVTSKGNCKGCGDAIKGKSISSADGRLTGRYHKECFVCTTCSEPFQTASFYVIDDAPYCERHYHKLNGSTCTTCDRGIEGQYLESERKQKFHPACLTCADCKRTLRNDYFEMGGRVYCERDAFRRAQRGRYLGPGSATNRMERRTTRLMMM